MGPEEEWKKLRKLRMLPIACVKYQFLKMRQQRAGFWSMYGQSRKKVNTDLPSTEVNGADAARVQLKSSPIRGAIWTSS